MSHSFFSLPGSRNPAATSSSSKLLPCSEPLAPSANTEPLNVLPPVRGTTLITGPPASASPSPPVMSIETSETFCVSVT